MTGMPNPPFFLMLALPTLEAAFVQPVVKFPLKPHVNSTVLLSKRVKVFFTVCDVAFALINGVVEQAPSNV